MLHPRHTLVSQAVESPMPPPLPSHAYQIHKHPRETSSTTAPSPYTAFTTSATCESFSLSYTNPPPYLTSTSTIGPNLTMSLTTNLTIISLLGGPASGKGTQSTHLTTHFPTKRIHHISIGDMPREEMQDSASPYASLLQENMLAGRLGPPDMTVRILKRNLERVESGTVVVLDGESENQVKRRARAC